MVLRFLIGATLLSAAVTASAQEARVLDFRAGKHNAISDASVVGGADGEALNLAVASAMLEQGRAEISPVEAPAVTLDVPRRTDTARVPLWLRPRGRLDASSFTVPRFGSATATGSFASCGVHGYRPAGWLSAAVERRRSAFYATMAGVACEFGVPTHLLDALITQESGYNAFAVSSAGAMGMAQIMPGTARYLGLGNPFDPVANLRAGARYLREQLVKFGGRADLALAAYNAGPARVAKNWTVPMIAETRGYVAAITNNWAKLSASRVYLEAAVDRGKIAARVAAPMLAGAQLVRFD